MERRRERERGRERRERGVGERERERTENMMEWFVEPYPERSGEMCPEVGRYLYILNVSLGVKRRIVFL